MICYEDIEFNFFCCDMCLLEIYECCICNKQLKLIDIIKRLHHKKIYKIDIKNS